MIRRTYLVLFAVAVALTAVLSGCRDKTPEPTPVGALLFTQPVSTTVYEQASGALTGWRNSSEPHPTLVLFSNDPFLKQIPQPAQQPLKDALGNLDDASWLAVSNPLQPDPLLLPEMTVTAALLNRMFAEVVWVVASEPGIDTLSAEFMGKQLQDYGAFGPYNQVLEKRDGAFYGHLFETPVRIVSADKLPDLAGPVVVHIDLSHFSTLYKDEVRTPLLKALRMFANDVRKQQWTTQMLTLSASNLDGRMPLASRNIALLLARLASEPALLDQELPEDWDILGKALYQETFFQMESALDLYRDLAQKDPGNAYAHYGAYQALKQMKRPEEALAELAESCRLDPVYAVEYQQLARQALQAEQYLLCVDMLQLAKHWLPNNVFIDLQLTETYVHFKKTKPALDAIAQLRQRTWSLAFYSGIIVKLQQWQDQLTNDNSPPDKES